LLAKRSVILGYHGVAESPRRQDLSLLLLSPARFRAQIELLLEAGAKFVTVAEMVKLGAGGEPPPGHVAVSFDDGMRNNHAVALPILRDLGATATVYVTVSFINGHSPWVGARGDRAMLSEPEIRELAREGWEIGAHTITHPDMSQLDYDSCRQEITDSRVALEQIAGAAVETFAYPFGRRGPAARDAVRDSGLIAAVSTGKGSWDPYELRRAMIGAADPLAVVLLKMADRYEPLLALPPLHAARTASKRLRGHQQARQL